MHILANLPYFMAQQLKTIYQYTYEVQSPESCSVTDADGKLILTVNPGAPAQFTADGRPVTLSAASATMRETRGRVAASEPGPTLSATGEPIVSLSGNTLTMQHTRWFDNSTQSAITIIPAAWNNEVMTSYLKTSIPVTLSGVTWLYGEPAMVSGYTYVIAMQQLDASTVFANLAYTIPQ